MKTLFCGLPDKPAFYPAGFCGWVNFGAWLLHGVASSNCPRRFMLHSTLPVYKDAYKGKTV